MGLIYSPRFIIFGALGTVLLNQVPVRREDTYGQRQISETDRTDSCLFYSPRQEHINQNYSSFFISVFPSVCEYDKMIG